MVMEYGDRGQLHMIVQKKKMDMPYQKKIRRMVLCLGCAAVMCMSSSSGLPGVFPLEAQAAESSVIESLSVTFESTWGDAEEILEPQIRVSGSGVSLADVQFGTVPENWKPGKKVRVEVNVVADEGKYFPTSLGSSKCKVSGATFVSAKALDDNTLQVKADYLPVTVLGTTQEAGWSNSTSKKAVWKRVSYAPGYSLTLYGNDKVVKRMTVTSNTADLSDYMKDSDKYYYYEVKAVPVTDAQKKYLKEGEIVLSSERMLDESFKGDHYVSPDGSLAVNTWKKIDGSWYYFGADGNRSRGWTNYGNRWYYMDGNGVMQTGWIFPGDGSWYYLGPDGDMVTGWLQQTPGTWYYLNGDGRMHTGWLLLNNTWYYLNADGRMHTGWFFYNNNWYYLNGQGEMVVNTMREGWRIGADGIAGKE